VPKNGFSTGGTITQIRPPPVATGASVGCDPQAPSNMLSTASKLRKTTNFLLDIFFSLFMVVSKNLDKLKRNWGSLTSYFE
jgi:hypothetical protein